MSPRRAKGATAEQSRAEQRRSRRRKRKGREKLYLYKRKKEKEEEEEKSDHKRAQEIEDEHFPWISFSWLAVRYQIKRYISQCCMVLWSPDEINSRSKLAFGFESVSMQMQAIFSHKFRTQSAAVFQHGNNSFCMIAEVEQR